VSVFYWAPGVATLEWDLGSRRWSKLKIKSVESEVLFPVPFWAIDYEGFDAVKEALLGESRESPQ
jgi:hypothetical protein